MPVSFNTQVGATTQSSIGFGGQAAGVQAAARGGAALRAAKSREAKRQSEAQLELQKDQFDTRMGMEREQFGKTHAMQKKAQKYAEKKDAKAERVARVGTSVQVGKFGLEMANEYDIDLANNLGFGEESIDAPGQSGGPPDGGGMKAVDSTKNLAVHQDYGMDGSAKNTEVRGRGVGAQPTESGQSQSWWSQHGGQVFGAVAGGATGGLMGSQMSMALFGEGKTQSTAGGAMGGAMGGYAGSGSGWGGLAGLAIGGVMGYLLG